MSQTGAVKRFFHLNLLVMRVLGFYPPCRFKKIYKVYAYAVYVCFTVPVPTLAAVNLLVDKNVDFGKVSDNCFTIFQVGCFIFKLIPFVFNADEIRKTIYMLESPLFNSYTKKQEPIIEKCAQICRTNTWLFLGSCIMSFVTWAAVPLFGHSRKFPVDVWLPFNATSSTKIYISTYLFIITGLGNGAIVNGAIDPLVSGMACFAAYQLKVLKNNLQFLNEVDEEERGSCSREEFKSKMMYEKIKTCIRHQTAILEFIKYYEKVYSTVVFTQFMAAVVVVCVSCLQLSMVEPFTFSFFSMVLFLSTMLLEIFLYSYFGTRLFEESDSLTSAIYMGQWYEYDPKCRKALIIIMERSKKPVTVIAGKILDLSLVTFTTILRRAYSLLAVLKNYQLDI